MQRKMPVNDRNKVREELKNEVKEYNASLKKRTSISKQEIEKSGIQLSIKQNELYTTIRNNTLTTVQGPAGTSKTFTACYTALRLLADKKVERIILTKPIQESGEQLGFLPGNVEEKVEPFMRSYFSNFEKIISRQSLSFMKTNNEIIVEPLAYMRGTTYDGAIILLDEAQNATIKQIMLWITRLGKESKAVLMGDISQYDIKKQDSKFIDFIQMVNGVEGIANFSFTKEDIVRNKILIEIVDRYEKLKNENKFC
jgi:phosphate starvation-inducible PhoH-like protein